MTTHIQNYGFTKTYIKDNKKRFNNEVKWIGDYDGDKANIQLDINDNGDKKIVTMQLDNNDIINILGIQPVQMSLENRLTNDLLNIPITLEGALTERKPHNIYNHKSYSKKHNNYSKRHNNHKSYSKKYNSHKPYSRKYNSHKPYSRKLKHRFRNKI